MVAVAVAVPDVRLDLLDQGPGSAREGALQLVDRQIGDAPDRALEAMRNPRRSIEAAAIGSSTTRRRRT